MLNEVRKTSILVWIGISAFLLLSSCSVERKMAKQFVARAQQYPCLVLYPSEVLVTNLKHDQRSESFYFIDAVKDTSLFRNSMILRTLNDDSLIQPFQDAFRSEMGQYGLKVYSGDEMEQFTLIREPSLLVNVAQLEIQEYYTDYEDKISVGEDIYSKVIYLTSINLGAWFEVAKMDSVHEVKYPVLFASHDLTDRWNGYFTQKLLTGEIQYKLEIDTISIGEGSSFARYLGRLYAAYTFDYLMNDYIQKSIPPASQTQKYYRYDPYKKWIFTTEKDRFILLD